MKISTNIKRQDIKKILERIVKYDQSNLPVVALLVACCFIDTLSKNKTNEGRRQKFSKYIKSKMPNTFSQLQENDQVRKKQIENFVNNGKHIKHNASKCGSSINILYYHVRCGLIHKYFDDERIKYINRPNKKQISIIVDQSNKPGLKDTPLVINAPGFVHDFLESL